MIRSRFQLYLITYYYSLVFNTKILYQNTKTYYQVFDETIQLYYHRSQSLKSLNKYSKDIGHDIKQVE